MIKKVSVSFLSSKNAKKDLKRLDLSNCDYIHVDEMDGKFVKKKNKVYRLLKHFSGKINKRLDVHLMVKNPKRLINKYALLNTEYITIHSEIDKVDKYIDLIKEYGIKVGIAINPNTDVSILEPYIDKIDLVLVMSVYPGAGGQEFISDTTKTILKVKKMIVNHKTRVKISVDGGVNDETSKRLDFADILVSGSYVIGCDNIDEAVDTLISNSSKNSKKNKDNK